MIVFSAHIRPIASLAADVHLTNSRSSRSRSSLLCVRAQAPSFYLPGKFLDGFFYKESLPLRRVVTATCSELTEEANGVDDTEFSDKRISGSLRDFGDGIKVCSH